MARLLIAFCAFGLITAASARAQSPTAFYEKTHKIKIGGDGGWDYLSVDPEARRLYVSRGNRIAVVDIDSETAVGEIKDTPGVHGAAIAAAAGKGFTSNGGNDTVTAFDLKTLKPIATIKVGGRPDAIMFDPESNRVFTYNHGSKDASAVDVETLKMVGSVALEGVPEAAVSDGTGKVFVNLMDKNEVAEFDAKTLKVLKHWSIAPGVRPTGLAMDKKTRRLFTVCGNSKMLVSDADKGKMIAELPIGPGSDGCFFDADRGLAFSSNGGDGTVSIVKEESPEKFSVVGSIKTQTGSRTMTLDPKTHRLYLASAEFEPAPAPKADEGKAKAAGKGFGRRGRMVPNSFSVIVVGE